MSIKKEEVIQFVTISGVKVTLLSGVVKEGSKAESVLKAIRAHCEKEEVIERASRTATVLIDEHENRTYRPNIDYLCSCLATRNMVAKMNWLLSLALSIVKPQVDCKHIIYSTSDSFLKYLEEIVNGNH